MNPFRLTPDVAPIFFADVIIDLDRRAAAVERVTAAALGTGDPIVLAGLYAVVVGLETLALKALECLTTIIECASRFGNVTWPIRAGPVNPPALHSMYMMRPAC